MARNGYPDDPDNYAESDPTQYANYGGGGQAYSEYGSQAYSEYDTGGQPAAYGQPTGSAPAVPGYAPPTG